MQKFSPEFFRSVKQHLTQEITKIPKEFLVLGVDTRYNSMQANTGRPREEIAMLKFKDSAGEETTVEEVSDVKFSDIGVHYVDTKNGTSNCKLYCDLEEVAVQVKVTEQMQERSRGLRMHKSDKGKGIETSRDRVR